MLLKPLSAYWPKIEIAPKNQLKAYQISVVTTVVLGALSAVAAYYIAAAILATAAITFSVLAYNKHKALNPTDTKTSSVAAPATQASSATATQASTPAAPTPSTPATTPTAPAVATSNPQPASSMPTAPDSLSRLPQDHCLHTLAMIQQRANEDKKFEEQIERMQESVRISTYDINKLPFANPCKVNVLPRMKFDSTDPITLATELHKNNPDDIIMIVNDANPSHAGGNPGAEIQEDGSFAPQQSPAGFETEELLGRTTGYLFAISPAANQNLVDKLQEKYKTNTFRIESGLSAITMQEVPVVKDYQGKTLSSSFSVDIINIATPNKKATAAVYKSNTENNFTLCMLAAKQRAEETNKRVQLIFCSLGFNSESDKSFTKKVMDKIEDLGIKNEDKFRRALPSIVAEVMENYSDLPNVTPHFTIESESHREKFTKLYNGAQGKVTPVIRVPAPVAVASAAPATAPATAVASASGATSSAPAATPAAPTPVGATSASTTPSSVAPATRKWKRVTNESRCGIQ